MIGKKVCVDGLFIRQRATCTLDFDISLERLHNTCLQSEDRN